MLRVFVEPTHHCFDFDGDISYSYPKGFNLITWFSRYYVLESFYFKLPYYTGFMENGYPIYTAFQIGFQVTSSVEDVLEKLAQDGVKLVEVL